MVSCSDGDEVNEFHRGNGVKTWCGEFEGVCKQKKKTVGGGSGRERLSDNVFRRILGDWIVC